MLYWGCEDDTAAEDNDMSETLGQKQRRFTRMIGQLIETAARVGGLLPGCKPAGRMLN